MGATDNEVVNVFRGKGIQFVVNIAIIFKTNILFAGISRKFTKDLFHEIVFSVFDLRLIKSQKLQNCQCVKNFISEIVTCLIINDSNNNHVRAFAEKIFLQIKVFLRICKQCTFAKNGHFSIPNCDPMFDFFIIFNVIFSIYWRISQNTFMKMELWRKSFYCLQFDKVE